MAKTLLDGAVRGSYFKLDPFEIVIIGLDTDDGPEHALYDKRITLPLDEDMIAGISLLGVLTPIRVVVIDGKPYATDGRQRVRNAREASSRLKAKGEPHEIVVPAIAEKMGDEDRQAMIGTITNEHRFGDSPLIRAQKMQQLLDRVGDVKKVALAFRVSVATVQANLKLGSLSAPVKKAIEAGTLSPTAAAKLADLPKADQVAALELATESPGRASVAKVTRTVDPNAPRPPGKKALHEAVERLGDTDFANGIRYALGILAANDVPEALKGAAE